jgi:hypothetical protein
MRFIRQMALIRLEKRYGPFSMKRRPKNEQNEQNRLFISCHLMNDLNAQLEGRYS